MITLVGGFAGVALELLRDRLVGDGPAMQPCTCNSQEVRGGAGNSSLLLPLLLLLHLLIMTLLLVYATMWHTSHLQVCPLP
jgi:hypothetical protein